jgi:hypothetical protein
MSTDLRDLDVVLDLCTAADRRIVLAVLLREQRRLTLNDLVKWILMQRHDGPLTEIPSEEINRIRLSLHHHHVPKLSDAGVITYDRERRLVEPTEELDKLRPSLSPIIEMESVTDTPENG